ncbi:hypothetical protein ACLB2K_035321 [Fragaria x ananassa]
MLRTWCFEEYGEVAGSGGRVQQRAEKSASHNEKSKKSYTADVAEFDLVMQTMKAGTHDLESCLEDNTCLPLGGYRFYTLVVLYTGLFGKPVFQNLICNGLVLDEDGQACISTMPIGFLSRMQRDLRLKGLPLLSLLIKPTLQKSSDVLDQWMNSATVSLVYFVRQEMNGYRLYTQNKATVLVHKGKDFPCFVAVSFSCVVLLLMADLSVFVACMSRTWCFEEYGEVAGTSQNISASRLNSVADSGRELRR